MFSLWGMSVPEELMEAIDSDIAISKQKLGQPDMQQFKHNSFFQPKSCPLTDTFSASKLWWLGA